MDLVDYSQEAYDRVVKEYTDFAAKLNVQDVRFIPYVRPSRRQCRHPQ